MAKKQRELLIRHYERAINGIDKTVTQLGILRNTYDEAGENYKSYSNFIDLMILQARQLEENLKLFRSNFL